MKLIALVVCLALVGCCPPKYIYSAVPQNLIPREPNLPKIESEALQCLSDQAYIDLATRDRLLRQDNTYLRALLGSGK